ncbi:MAG: acyl carrier protein [Caldilineaceae bacterium]
MTTMTQIQPHGIAQLLRTHILEEIAYDRSDLELTDDFELIERGVIDSMGMLRVVTFLEEKFAIVMEPEDMTLENFATIDAIATYVMSKRTAV